MNHLVKAYLKFLLHSKSEHGIHSPFHEFLNQTRGLSQLLLKMQELVLKMPNYYFVLHSIFNPKLF